MSGSRWSGSITSRAQRGCSSRGRSGEPRHTPELDPPRRVIVYCRSGTRAALAALTLKTLGYQDVANLDGGFNAWKEAGLPTGEHHSDL